MVVIIASAALAIDIGSFYKDQKRAQAAADAAALAAAADLPNSTTAANADGTTYATTNYPGSHPVVSPNYNNNSNNVKVTVSANSPSYFGQFFGFTSAHITASAVAGNGGRSAPAAIFGYDDNCSHSDVTFNGGNSTTVNGAVISNGAINYNSNPNSTITTGTYGGPNNCAYTNTGKGTFTNQPSFTSALTPFPVDYSTKVPACTATPLPGADGSTSYDWSKSQYEIPGGTSTAPIVYCADTITIEGAGITATNAVFIAKTIKLTGDNMTFTNTSFVADNFTVSGNHLSVAAPSDNLMFYDRTASTLDFTSQNMTINGAIYAPLATVQFDGNSTGSGFVEGEDVIINGNTFNVTGIGPVMGGNGDILLQ
jgi:Flp pilus assembly protein TadG